MNIFNIIKEIEKTKPEVFERQSDRRQVLKNLGSKVAAAALPLALGATAQKAYGKTTDSMVNVLNFLLEIEYLQYNLYHTALATGSNTTTFLIPVADRAGFQAIEADELAHLNFLRKAVDMLGAVPFTPKNYSGDPVTGNPYTPTAYDFTAHNNYQVYTDYDMFLTIANTIEDTGIRAYIGQIPELLGNSGDHMTHAMQISSVEGRHAAYIRLLRRKRGAVDNPKPWVSNNIPPIVALQRYYLGEDNIIQQGLDITSIKGVNGNIPAAAASEAFDEPLSKAEVNTLMAPFKVA